MKNKIINLYNLTRRDSTKELYDGFGGDPYLSEMTGWQKEHSWSNGLRSVYINLHERLIFTYVEGDYCLNVCNSPEEFYKELFEASNFYKGN